MTRLKNSVIADAVAEFLSLLINVSVYFLGNTFCAQNSRPVKVVQSVF